MTKNFIKTSSKVLVAGLAVALLLAPAVALADVPGTVGTWTTSPNTVPASPVNASYVTANGYAYAFGGTNNISNINNVSYAKLNSDGTTGTWTSSPNVLPNSLFYSSAVTYNGYAYVLGGYNYGYFNTVYYAKLNNDGSVGTWTTSPNTLPDAIYFATAVTANGYVYYMGGNDNGGSVNTVYYAKLNNDGSVGTWTTSPNHLPDTIISAAAVTANGYAYVIGGQGNSGTLNTVYYAKLNSDGTVGSWQASPNTLPQAIYGIEAVTENGYVYVMGGRQGSNIRNYVFYAPLNSDGTVGSWTTSSNSLPQARYFGMAFAANSYIYYAAGNLNGTAENAVYSAFVTPPPPGITNQNVNVAANSSVTVDVLSGVSGDPDSSTLSIVSGPSHGTAVDPPGTITYTPNAGYSGSDSLVYQVCSSLDNAVCSQATLSFDVTATTDPAAPDTGFGAPQKSSELPLILFGSASILLLAIGLTLLRRRRSTPKN